MNAGQIMTRNVWTVGPSATAREVARCLADRRVSAVPVVDPRAPFSVSSARAT